jgi:hypothetical protein
MSESEISVLKDKIRSLENTVKRQSDVIDLLIARSDGLNDFSELIKINENRIIALEHRVHYLEDDVLHVDLY